MSYVIGNISFGVQPEYLKKAEFVSKYGDKLASLSVDEAWKLYKEMMKKKSGKTDTSNEEVSESGFSPSDESDSE